MVGWFGKKKKVVVERSCDNCKHQRRMSCPNSSKCYDLEEKPYFKNREEVYIR